MSELAAPWWSKAVVYQIYPRSFADSDGDGFGDLPGIIDHLDHVAGLGSTSSGCRRSTARPRTTTATTSPTTRTSTPCSGRWPTSTSCSPVPTSAGLKLIMDLVVNHTSDEHPWFVESRDPASAKRDWYIWRPARAGFQPGRPGAEPTNWGSFFGGSAWQFDEASGEYYLHLFSRKQPDLNWENPEVRQAVYAMMNWWVDRGVDGFRMDVINLISKTYPLADGVVAPGQPFSFEIDRVANGPRPGGVPGGDEPRGRADRQATVHGRRDGRPAMSSTPARTRRSTTTGWAWCSPSSTSVSTRGRAASWTWRRCTCPT
jgi:oligo-1,6-glucosidase